MAPVDDQTNADPFLTANLPALAFAFDGPGALDRVALADFTAHSPGQLMYGWSSVIVPAGSKVAYLHFAVQQIDRSAV